MKYVYEAYEDNAGGLHLFALDDEQNVVWGFYYYGAEYMAACDWVGLLVQEIDPVEDGWESYENAVQDYKECYESAVQIASSENMTSYEDIARLGIYTNALNSAGKNFAIGCKVLYRCPECREIGECEFETQYGGRLSEPERCEFCGASLQ